MTNTTLLQILILRSITKEESYPYQIFKSIKNKGIDIKLYSVYNCLKSLEKKGYIKTITETSKKMHIISDQGIALLKNIKILLKK